MNVWNTSGGTNSYYHQIKDILSVPALCEQLAEECCELAQAALKKARKLRNENYTPKTMEEIDANVTEEYTDVLMTANLLDIDVDYKQIIDKTSRWISRLYFSKKNGEDLVNEDNRC